MDNFLKKYSLWSLKQEEIEIWTAITSCEVETVIKKLPTNKSPEPNSSTGKFYQTFREELVSIFLKLLKKFAEEGNLPNSFYEATITLIWRPDK